MDTIITAGIDIGKAHLDLGISSGAAGKKPAHRRFSNDEQGIRALIEYLPGSLAHIVLEPSGGYERLILQALQKAELPVSLVNAKWVRHYALSRGLLAKTDKLDAFVLADYARDNRPAPSRKLTPAQWKMQDCQRRRLQLVDALRREKCTLKQEHDVQLATMIEEHIAFIEGHIDRIDAVMQAIIAADLARARKNMVLRSCKGVGPVLSHTLLAQMPELGSIDARQAASFAGLAPVNHESGKHKGIRRIQGGRVQIRNALYMATLSAMRYNPDIKTFYEKKIKEGKPWKSVIIACARKLLLTLNSLLRDNRIWVPKMVIEHSCYDTGVSLKAESCIFISAN